MPADEAKIGTKDDYAALKSVVDALASRSQNTDSDREAQRLLEAGYLYKDSSGHIRLSVEGKLLLRRGTRSS